MYKCICMYTYSYACSHTQIYNLVSYNIVMCSNDKNYYYFKHVH